MVLLSVLGVAVAQSVWTSSIGYTIIPGASMVWVETMNIGNVDEGGTGSLSLSNVVTISLTKTQTYTIVLAITNAQDLKAHFSSLTLTFKEGTSGVAVLDLTTSSKQFTLSGPQSMKLNVAIAYTVQQSVTTNGQTVSGQISLSATFA